MELEYVFIYFFPIPRDCYSNNNNNDIITIIIVRWRTDRQVGGAH